MVSIDTLLDQVWLGVIVTPDSVYQAVTALRRQLGDDPKQPAYIATVPRRGYRLMAAVIRDAGAAAALAALLIGATMYLQGPLEKERWGLFVMNKTGGVWDKPTPLEQLNHPDGPTGDRSPCLSRDGTMLYFASDRPGGKGGLDLWVIKTAELRT